jgi:ribose transport system ATP-binding protein
MSSAAGQPILEVRNLSKHFGAIQALNDLSMSVHPGEVVALAGDNGAGKTTLIKTISGVFRPTAGEILLNGDQVSFSTPQEARDKGIETIYQDLALADNLSIGANIFLGRELRRGLFLDHRAMRAESRRLLARLNCTVDPRARVSDISVPNRQMVEIAKALGRHARVLIMDEPTAVLTARETDTLLELIARLRAEGTAILYTSHKLDEVSRIADRVTNVCERTAFVITGDPRALPGKVDPD